VEVFALSVTAGRHLTSGSVADQASRRTTRRIADGPRPVDLDIRALGTSTKSQRRMLGNAPKAW
jgi:hypothetical protein